MKIYQINWATNILHGVSLVAATNAHRALDHFKGTKSYKPNSKIEVEEKKDLAYTGIEGGVIVEA